MIPYEFSAERFSRWMAYVLRHNPDRYGLQPDKHGFVDLEEFLRIAGRRYPHLGPDRLKELIQEGGIGRFEVSGSRVRARYGHSIPAEPVGPPVEPQEFLFYGTDAASAEPILAEGLKPVDRRSLHLSTTPEEALTIAQRKTATPAVFRIRARDAHRSGIAFYKESALYLTGHVPAEYLSKEPLPQSVGGSNAPPAGAL